MNNLPQRTFIKITSVLLSVLLFWQGVVWASPDIFQRNNLQQRTLLFNPTDLKDSFSLVFGSYLSRFLDRIMQIPENRNLYDVRERINRLIDELKKSKVIPPEFLKKLPEQSGSLEEGAVWVDIGPCRIRFYNPRIPGMNDPGEKW